MTKENKCLNLKHQANTITFEILLVKSQACTANESLLAHFIGLLVMSL